VIPAEKLAALGADLKSLEEENKLHETQVKALSSGMQTLTNSIKFRCSAVYYLPYSCRAREIKGNPHGC